MKKGKRLAVLWSCRFWRNSTAFAGVWALQYAGSGPENVVAAGGAQQCKSIWMTDLFLDSDSRASFRRSPHHSVSPRCRAKISFSLIRIMPIVWALKAAFVVLSMNTNLTLKDDFFSSLLDQPAQAAL
ncbi:hypothetical protein ACNKHS_13570 [Shigella flexneri]